MPLTLIAFAATSLLAQAPPPVTVPAPSSASVAIGSGQTWDDEGSIGKGASVAGSFAYRFRPHWSVDGTVERLAHKRVTAGPIFSGRTIFTTAGIAYHFGETGVSPYAGGGFGGAFYSGTFTDVFGGTGVALERSSTSTAAYGNAGVDIPIGARLVVSPDFRLTICQAKDDFAPWSTLRFAIKAGVRF